MAQSRSEYLKQWKQKRYEEGICYRCGNELEKGYKTCSDCRAKAGKRHKKWVKKKREQGLCCHCGRQPTEGDEFYCPDCKERRNAARLKRQHKLKEKGICRKCKENPVGPTSTVHCEECYPEILAKGQKAHDKLKFDGNRKTTIKRDDHSCQICGSDERLEVHHIDGDRKNNELKNLITLCHNCHWIVTQLANSPDPEFILNLAVKVQN